MIQILAVGKLSMINENHNISNITWNLKGWITVMFVGTVEYNSQGWIWMMDTWVTYIFFILASLAKLKQ